MKAFTEMTIIQIKRMLRNRFGLVGSIGIAVISMLVFGSLFGSGGGGLAIGVVDQDQSTISQQMRQTLGSNVSLHVSTGSEDEELSALRQGQRQIVVVIPAGFGASVSKGQRIDLTSYVNKSDLLGATLASQVVTSIVDGINQGISNTPQIVGVQQKDITTKPLRNIDYLVPGFLGMLIMFANIFIGAQMIGWRERGILKRLSVTPITPLTVIGATIAAQVLFSLVQAVVFILMAVLLYQVPIEGSLLTLALLLVIGSLTMLGIGFIIGSFLNKSEGAATVTQLIAFPMMFLGGSYFSVAAAPGFLQPLVKAMPLTWLNEGLRQVFNNGDSIASTVVQLDLLVLLAWMVVSLFISVRLFRWQSA